MDTRSRWPLIPLALLAVLAFSAHAAGPHPVTPGYKPSNANDEQGIWMQMQEAEVEIARSPLLVTEPDLREYVQSIVCRVAGDYCPDVRVYIVRNPGFNASMAPNGMMVVWTGLLLRAKDEDELATVIGHEIAHYVRAHSLLRLRNMKSNLAVGAFVGLGIGATTGVYGVGETLGILGALAYTRDQESEADAIGVEMIAASGYDATASYELWEALIAEDTYAVAKSDKVSGFLRTHPQSDSRAAELRKLTSGDESSGARPERSVDRHRQMIETHYVWMMQDQIDTNRYGRTEYMLKRHEANGIDAGLIAYFHGEIFRQRGEDGDNELATNAYLVAAQSDMAPPETFRNLGYLALKAGSDESARQYFRDYLQRRPDASDREMIEFYIED